MSPWVVIALWSAAVSALVSIFDKTVLYRYARSPLTLPLLIGIAQTSVGLLLLAAVRVPADAPWDAVAWSALSGALFGLSGQLLMRVLYTEEVSRTIPVTQTAPIFAAVIALLFLEETVSSLQWLAIIATVAGAVFLSLRIDRELSRIFLHRSFYLLILAAFIAGTANVTGKLAVDELPVLFAHAMRMLFLGFVFLAFNARAVPWSDIRGFFAVRSPALIFVGLNELIIANVGLLLLLWALSLGPVSLVSAIAGTRALFVVLYSTALAAVWKGALGEQTSSGAIAVKLGSTALIVAGIVGVAV